jgi:hypothetical protein
VLVWSGYRESNSEIILGKDSGYLYIIPAYMVGVQGFEPWTLWSQTRCATRLRYTPKNFNLELLEANKEHF